MISGINILVLKESKNKCIHQKQSKQKIKKIMY